VTAEQAIYVVTALGVYGLALVGVVVAAYWARFAAADFHRAATARVAAYTGGPLHLTIRHHRSTRG